MAARQLRRSDGNRDRRRVQPLLEILDHRELMSTTAGIELANHHGDSLGSYSSALGSFVSPGTGFPRLSSKGHGVDPHQAINRELVSSLGPGTKRLARQVETSGASERSRVSERILTLPFIHGILSRNDTFRLLNSSGVRGLIFGDPLANSYPTTGTVLEDALRASQPSKAPSVSNDVPGLRLFNAAVTNKNLTHDHTHLFLRYLRIAADRRLFDLVGPQAEQVEDRFQQFLNTVQTLQRQGSFDVPNAPPVTLVDGPLNGTLSVTTSVYRELLATDPVTGETRVVGFDFPKGTNFPGRIDVGWVFDRRGNYGIILTARGPLFNAIPGLNEANRVGGEVQVGVSNAAQISGLEGLKNIEALTMGSVVSGSMTASNSSGVATFSAGAGYGAGLDFGVGANYTEVIPLGNVLRFPGRRI